jgi:hypothetical protein
MVIIKIHLPWAPLVVSLSNLDRSGPFTLRRAQGERTLAFERLSLRERPRRKARVRGCHNSYDVPSTLPLSRRERDSKENDSWKGGGKLP